MTTTEILAEVHITDETIQDLLEEQEILFRVMGLKSHDKRHVRKFSETHPLSYVFFYPDSTYIIKYQQHLETKEGDPLFVLPFPVPTSKKDLVEYISQYYQEVYLKEKEQG